MIAGLHPLVQSLLGTFFTWGLTAAGAGLVFIWSGGKRKVLDASLGFAAGVMLAASYWSLLAPAIEMAEDSGLYGPFTFVPVSVGFLLGAGFVYAADVLLPYLGVQSSNPAVMAHDTDYRDAGKASDVDATASPDHGFTATIGSSYGWSNAVTSSGTSARPRVKKSSSLEAQVPHEDVHLSLSHREPNWRRILLLIVAITVHNIPEGLAVGVGFGAVGKSTTATFESARNLAIGIGIQNFPEGLAVSLPLRAAGMSVWKSFWYGQLSGMVEPLAGLFGTVAVVVAEPVLPYALAFAAGAMVFVVVDDIVPEANSCGNGRLASIGSLVGFVVMMSLDVGLG